MNACSSKNVENNVCFYSLDGLYLEGDDAQAANYLRFLFMLNLLDANALPKISLQDFQDNMFCQ